MLNWIASDHHHVVKHTLEGAQERWLDGCSNFVLSRSGCHVGAGKEAYWQEQVIERAMGGHKYLFVPPDMTHVAIRRSVP